MESGIVGEPLSVSGEGAINHNTLSSITYTSLFEEHLPFYLSIGMPYEMFWNDDVYIAKHYRRAYDLQKEQINEKLWLQGLYVYNAIVAVAPALKAIGGQPPEKYIEAPLPLTESALEERRKKEAKAKQEEMRDRAEAFASAFNKQLRERKEENDVGSNDQQT